jgi:hypothetical protein
MHEKTANLLRDSILLVEPSAKAEVREYCDGLVFGLVTDQDFTRCLGLLAVYLLSRTTYADLDPWVEEDLCRGFRSEVIGLDGTEIIYY